mgnify:CR=1 FL=1
MIKCRTKRLAEEARALLADRHPCDIADGRTLIGFATGADEDAAIIILKDLEASRRARTWRKWNDGNLEE